MSSEIRLSMSQSTQQLYATVYDENWTYTDKQGHVHAYIKDGDTHYPTLERVETHVYCDCCEGYTATHYECRQCNEIIGPGTRMGTFLYADQVQCSLNGMPITKTQFDHIQKQIQSRADKNIPTVTCVVNGKPVKVVAHQPVNYCMAVLLAEMRTDGLYDIQYKKPLEGGAISAGVLQFAVHDVNDAHAVMPVDGMTITIKPMKLEERAVSQKYLKRALKYLKSVTIDQKMVHTPEVRIITVNPDTRAQRDKKTRKRG